MGSLPMAWSPPTRGSHTMVRLALLVVQRCPRLDWRGWSWGEPGASRSSKAAKYGPKTNLDPELLLFLVPYSTLAAHSFAPSVLRIRTARQGVVSSFHLCPDKAQDQRFGAEARTEAALTTSPRQPSPETHRSDAGTTSNT